MRTLVEIASALQAGDMARDLIEGCLSTITDPSGQGARTFLKVHSESAITTAECYDRMRINGTVPSPFAGIPLSIKDNFDTEGEVTTAGSVALRDNAPARADALCISRLKAAGFVLIGRTNMTEFAFSTLGINPHYGTPLNPYDRANGRIPGGSSSGAAVSVSDGMAFAGLGTDTGGSCRIPAAFCGIVGFKPTAHRIPTRGTFPLSTSLDSVGSLAATVKCCAILDTVLSGEDTFDLPSWPVQTLRLAVPQSAVLDDLEGTVAGAFAAALAAVSKMGARLFEIPLKELEEIMQMNRKGGLTTAEPYAVHRSLIATKGSMYDPSLLRRILLGKEQDAADYVELLRARADLIQRMEEIGASYDAFLMPTVPLVAPRFDDLQSQDAYSHPHTLLLRNTSIANFLDRCAISIPCHYPGDAPVGLMLIGEHDGDRKLLSMAAEIERIVSPVCRRA